MMNIKGKILSKGELRVIETFIKLGFQPPLILDGDTLYFKNIRVTPDMYDDIIFEIEEQTLMRI
jgi:hypothetical protein